ncbi:hypothetical protein HZB94_01030 [Candidatus Falkowbacteria bacterium]|nr:hypothetical protein [Candidatus Falkowbacteria bacterium]
MRGFLLVGFCWLAAGCAANGSAGINAGMFERRTRAPAVDFGGENDTVFNESQNVHFSSYGGNERRFEVSEVKEFIYPIEWLNDPKSLKGKIYLVKQVDGASIFCLVKPDEVKYPGSKKSSAEYSVFLVRQVSAKKIDTWREFLQARFGQTFSDFRVLDIDAFKVIYVNRQDEQYANAPIVFTEQGGRVYEVALLYRGLSRRYADELLNKFPWRIFANN